MLQQGQVRCLAHFIHCWVEKSPPDPLPSALIVSMGEHVSMGETITHVCLFVYVSIFGSGAIFGLFLVLA